MRALSIVACNCTNCQSVINALPCILWGILGLIAFYLVLKYIIHPCIVHKNEMKAKWSTFSDEKEWYKIKKDAEEERLALKIKEYNELTKIVQNDELDRKVKEYNELTIHQKLLDKATGTDMEIQDLKKALEELNKKYESLNGEIEQIIIKKK